MARCPCVLPCVACVVIRCRVLPWAAVCCSVLQSLPVCYDCCRVLQCVALCCSVLRQWVFSGTRWCVAHVSSRMLQCVAVCCGILQCVTVVYSKLSQVFCGVWLVLIVVSSIICVAMPFVGLVCLFLCSVFLFHVFFLHCLVSFAKEPSYSKAHSQNSRHLLGILQHTTVTHCNTLQRAHGNTM